MSGAGQESAAGQVTLTINGVPVTAPVGSTVLQAARSAGIEIPTLCYLEGLSGFGACRLCLVEVRKGAGRSRTVVSCLYPVEEGLLVETETDRIAHHRKLILELIAARWDRIPRDLAERYGVDLNRFRKRTTYCILCGLCVRHCAEVEGRHVLGFLCRGAERQVVLYPEVARVQCPECAKDGVMPCLQVCPTGVITSEYAVPSLGAGARAPIAFPVCIRDDDNAREVARKVGDTGR